MSVPVYVADREAAERMGVAGQLRDRGFAVSVGSEFATGADVCAAEVGEARAICSALSQISAGVMDAAPNLELIVKSGIGVDNIDVAAARERGLPVLRAGGVNSDGPAEWVIGAAIALLRRFDEFDAAIRRGEWSELRAASSGLLPALTGRTLGIAGLGSIGARLAALGRAHGMEVIAFDPFLSPEAALAAGARLVERDQLFREADVLSLNVVLTEQTRHFVSTAELELMRPQAILLNCSRGPVVDQAALAAALSAGRIAGAAIDVFEAEPPERDNPLFELPNVLLTPHLGGCTDYGYHEIGEMAADLIARFFAGEPVPEIAVAQTAESLAVAPAGVSR
jgi:D-3-phosphoglycerate dehydrogenase / 2-oxoglutarate reductase